MNYSQENIKLVLVGAGNRGTDYARIAKNCGAQIVAVAEPRSFFRNRIAKEHSIAPENIFVDWKELLIGKDKLADGAIIATGDTLHVEPAEVAASKAYHLLLEKPMAPTVEGCHRIINAVKANGIMFAVCHVLRYTNYTQKIISLIESGIIGDIVSIRRLEPVAYWHQVHSYVRGNSRNSQESSFMLLAKSCHDLDWIRYVMNCHCLKVSSFGSLYHFRKESKPEGAGLRCTECSIEPQCPFSAKKIYLKRLEEGQTGWPVNMVSTELTNDGVLKVLEKGPYGRCVYDCDNDVVDNQVVNMSFENGKTASFLMTGFTKGGSRQTDIFGTRGELRGDTSKIVHYDFLTDKSVTYDVDSPDASILGGHGGGDEKLIESFITALKENDPSKILSGPEETLESHLMVFAAEQSRLTGCVVEM